MMVKTQTLSTLIFAFVVAGLPPVMAEVLQSNGPVLDSQMQNRQIFVAANGNRSRRKAVRSRSKKSSTGEVSSGKKRRDPNFAKAKALANAHKYDLASRLLFQMSRNPKYQKEAAQIKYVLGLMLYELKLHQSAAFVFFDVIKNESRRDPKSKYLRLSLEKLALSADSLNSDVLLKYAIKQVKEDEFPASNRDMLYYRIGEINLNEKKYIEAARQFSRIKENSLFYTRARYKLGLSLAEAGQTEKAVVVFDDLAQFSSRFGVTNSNRVNALMGKARVLYQRKDFSEATEVYRSIPRDTPQWHDALFESSWSMVRDGQFRAALSNFHSLHSSFYEDIYQPESLIVRAIVYLYICRHEEMGKVLDLFSKVYKPSYRDLRDLVKSAHEPITYYREIAGLQESLGDSSENSKIRVGEGRIPKLIGRHILDESDVKRAMSYLHKLDEERDRISSMSIDWRSSSVGQYSIKIVDRRIESTRKMIGLLVRRHILSIMESLRRFSEQEGLLKFEMLSSKREALRNEIASKGVEPLQIDEETERNFYVQNGFDYWPFKGEYWLDEIGNYHYVGVRACEQQ